MTEAFAGGRLLPLVQPDAQGSAPHRVTLLDLATGRPAEGASARGFADARGLPSVVRRRGAFLRF